MLCAWEQWSKSATSQRHCIAGSNRARHWPACRCPTICLASFDRWRNGRRLTSCGPGCTAARRRPLRDASGGGSYPARSNVIVVDASALLEALLRAPTAKTVEARLFAPYQTLHAPHLLDVEVAQVIRRYATSGEIDGERGRMALADLADFPLRRYPHDFLLPRIWDLRNSLAAYDATYVALAEALDAPLLTRGQTFGDRRRPSRADRFDIIPSNFAAARRTCPTAGEMRQAYSACQFSQSRKFWSLRRPAKDLLLAWDERPGSIRV